MNILIKAVIKRLIASYQRLPLQAFHDQLAGFVQKSGSHMTGHWLQASSSTCENFCYRIFEIDQNGRFLSEVRSLMEDCPEMDYYWVNLNTQEIISHYKQDGYHAFLNQKPGTRFLIIATNTTGALRTLWAQINAPQPQPAKTALIEG
jgi:hypothetical protein